MQEIIPIINWETKTFSTPVLAVLVFASVALFPTLLLPSSPSMWVAGMTFGYGYGFLLIISGMAVGVSLPYFIGSLFYHKIQVRMSAVFIIYCLLLALSLVVSLSTCTFECVCVCECAHNVNSTFVDSNVGVVRKVSKESFHSKSSW